MYKKCEEILKELESEEKVKVWWEYKFPSKEPLKLRLKDMLEDEVDEKYYLSDVQIDRIKATNYVSGGVCTESSTIRRNMQYISSTRLERS